MFYFIVVLLIIFWVYIKFFRNRKNRNGQYASSSEEKQNRELVEKLKNEASNGVVQSMIWLGDIYSQGPTGIPRDERKALKYWKMAADYGNTDMSFKAGLLIGRLDENYVEAFRYIKCAADAGNPDAMYTLANFLANGWGCQADKHAAYHYMKLAAESGQKNAIYELQNW